MPKSIKINEADYKYLRQIQEARETYSDVVERLCRAYRALANIYVEAGFNTGKQVGDDSRQAD